MNNKMINIVLGILVVLLLNTNVYAMDSIPDTNLVHEIKVKNIIRIDVFRIRDVEGFLVEIDPILEKNGFKFKTNEIEDVDFSINDPEPLRTQQFMKHAEGY